MTAKNDWEKLFKGELSLDMMKRPGLYRIDVTPQLAGEWLKINTGNRRIRQTLVDYLAGQIERGEWQAEHPQPVVFSDACRMIDGQHRMAAIVQVNKSCVVLVRTGVPDGVREYLDTGIVRTLDDRVGFVEDLRLNKICSQLITNWWFNVKGNRIGGKCSPEQAREMFAEHEQAILSIAALMRKDRAVGRIPVAVAAIEFYERNPTMAVEFYAALFEIDSPLQQARVFRDWLLRNIGEQWGSKVSKDLYARAVYCMSCYEHGKKVASIRGGSWE